MDELLKALKDGWHDDENAIHMLAILRDKILDYEAISEHEGHDVLPEMVARPDHVVYYAGVYIEMLKEGRKDGR